MKEFDDEQSLRAAELKRQETMLAIFVPVISVVGTLSSVRDLQAGHFGTGIAGAIATVLVVLAAFLYFWHRRVGLVTFPFALLCIVGIFSAMIDGGPGGSSSNWAIAFPPVIFFFLGLRLGVYAVGMHIAVLIGYWLLIRQGALHHFYSAIQLRELLFAVVVVAILSYVAERGWSKAREAVARQRENLKVLLKNLPVGVMLIDAGGKAVLTANASIGALLGRQPAAGEDAHAFLRSLGLAKENGTPYPDAELPLWTALAGGTSVKNDVVVNSAAGAMTLRVTGAPLRDPSVGIMGIVLIVEDATKEHEIDRMKSEFVAIASHQLKTPLTAIKWSSESLTNGDTGTLSAPQREVVVQITDITDRLVRLVGELLEVSHIETGRKFELKPADVDLAELVAGITKELTPTAAARDVTVRLDAPGKAMAWVDTKKTREGVTNIVSNAIKYSRKGGEVKVRVFEQDAAMIGIDVRDAGIGIPQEARKHLFEKFYRAPNVGEAEGTGLGLYIVRAIVERSGGRIWFDSEEGKGTTFHITLPRKAVVAA